jgi:hypothetical protein
MGDGIARKTCLGLDFEQGPPPSHCLLQRFKKEG